MNRLIIEANNGTEYQAKARLENEAGRELISGTAVLTARQGYRTAQSGNYAFDVLKELPRDVAVLREFGAQALFFASTYAGGEPVMVHGGEFDEGGRLRGVCGSIRVDQKLLNALISVVTYQTLNHGQASLQLVLRIGQKPSGYKFWAQPSAQHRVHATDTVSFAPIDPYYNSNSALAWMLYFNHVDGISETHDHHDAGIKSGEGGDYGGGGASGGWPGVGQVANSLVDEPQALADVAPQEPLFAVSPLPGVDASGRVTDASDELACQVESTEPQGVTGFAAEVNANAQQCVPEEPAPAWPGTEQKSDLTEVSTSY